MRLRTTRDCLYWHRDTLNQSGGSISPDKLVRPVFKYFPCSDFRIQVIRITDLAAMEKIVNSGDADYIYLSRAFIADPKFPEKIRQGSRKPAGASIIICARLI